MPSEACGSPSFSAHGTMYLDSLCHGMSTRVLLKGLGVATLLIYHIYIFPGVDKLYIIYDNEHTTNELEVLT